MRNINRRVIKYTLGSLFLPVLCLLLGLVMELCGIRVSPSGAEIFVREVGILLFLAASLSLSLDFNTFDFSLGAIAYLSPILTFGLFPSVSDVGLILTSLGFGCLLGLITGGICVLTHIPFAWISLCMCLVYEGLATFCHTQRYPASGEFLGSTIAFFVIFSLLMCIFLYVVFEKSVFGRVCLAISQKPKLCKAAGVSVTMHKLILNMISGGMMGILGVMLYINEGRLIASGQNFTSMRILFFGLLPLFFGKLMSYCCGNFVGRILGCVGGATVYASMKIMGADENLRVIISSIILIFLLIYLSNRQKIFKRILPKKRLKNKS